MRPTAVGLVGKQRHKGGEIWTGLGGESEPVGQESRANVWGRGWGWVGGDHREGQGARFGMKVSGQEGWEGTGCGWWSISSSFLRIPER